MSCLKQGYKGYRLLNQYWCIFWKSVTRVTSVTGPFINTDVRILKNKSTKV